MKEMVGGCCVCSDDRGWTENPLVYCDGPNCTVAVHQACYGIVTVPLGNWYCRKCESADRNTKVRCELCPNKDGALKPTDNNAWAHVVCALYIPEVRFSNVSTMEPIVLSGIPPERFNKACYLCEESSRGSGRAMFGACMQCNKAGCKTQFHVTCAQSRGLLCEEAGNYMDNVKYCGYCHHHYTKIVIKKKGVNVKVIPPYKPVNPGSPESFKESESSKATSKRKLSTSSTKSSSGKTSSTSSVSSAGPEDIKSEDSSGSQPAKPPTPVPEPPKSPVAPEVKKRRKGESRTPPVTGLTPDGSPRPITPSGASMSGPLGSNLMQSATPTPSSSPSLGNLCTGQVLGSGSNASSPSEPKRPLLQAVLKDSARPNSIVVNVPLDVLPAGQGAITPTSVANIPALNPSVNLGTPVSAVSATTTLPQVDLTNASSLLAGSSQSTSTSPLKRSRSQSSEKTEKPRRSSKRSAGGSSSKPLSGSPTNTPNVQSANNSHNPSHSSTLPNHESAGTSKRRHSASHGTSHSASHSASHGTPHGASHGTPHGASHSASHGASHISTNHVPHGSTNHLSHQQPGGSASTTPGGHPQSLNMNHVTTAPSTSPSLQIKDEKTDIKLISSVDNSQVPHMLGNRLNPSSSMAQKMCDTLSQEVVAHSIFTSDQPVGNHLVGPQLPGRTHSNASASATNNTGWGGPNTTIPQSLEQLLERQWEQGSQFLMEQAQHFDIASLLTCLHQLRAENNTLEEQVSQLVQRRDHLLAVNARLAIPLVPPVTTPATTSNPQNGNPSTAPSGLPQTSQIVENGLPPASSPQDIANFRSSTIRQNSSNPPNINSGTGGNFGNPTSAQNSVLVRTSAADNRRSSHSPASSVYNTNPLFQPSQSQVVMRRDVIELNQSGSSKAS